MAPQRKVKKAFIAPASAYDEPAEVLADKSLSNVEKRRILESWEGDARALSMAEEENMAGGEPNRLGAVLEALSQLPPEKENERPHGPATMHGSQPAPSSRPKASAGTTLSAREARQGEIILKTPARRAIFVSGLVLAAVACVFGFYFAWGV